MSITAHIRDRGADQRDALATLLAKAGTGNIDAVEVVLGRFSGPAAVAAARQAADVAHRAERWDTLAYLADFIHDLSTHGGGSSGDSDGDSDGGSDGGSDSDGGRDSDGDSGGDSDRNINRVLGSGDTPLNVIQTPEDAHGITAACFMAKMDVDSHDFNLETVWDEITKCEQETIFSKCVTAVTGKPSDGFGLDADVPAEDRVNVTKCAEASAEAHFAITRVDSKKKSKKTPKSEPKDMKAKPVKAPKGEKPHKTKGGANGAMFTEIPKIMGFVQKRTPVYEMVVTFEIVDEDAAAGDHRSAEDPDPYVSIADPEEDIAKMLEADPIVVAAPTIRVLYSYPFGAAGPTKEEQDAEGWIFEEDAPDGKGFSRADIARVVSARYHAIYDEEARLSTVEPGYIPGTLRRNRTDGPYKIWDHDIGDLLLHTVDHDPATDLYTLNVVT
jgi:hypothetical protein